MKKILALAFASTFAAAGCGAGKAPADDSFDVLAGLDEKSDAFSAYMKIVGNITPGNSSSAISYVKGPRYRALKLTAKGPGTLALTVHSTDGGDALTWLLDTKYHTLAKNDDADDTTLDSHIIYNLPAGAADYWIVFRDYNWEKRHFVVQVAPIKAARTCDVGFNIPDEPPVALGEIETLFTSYLSSYQVYNGSEDACLDFSDAKVRAAVAEDVRANSGINWQDATPPVVQGSVKSGAADFLSALAYARQEVDNFAASSLTKSATFKDAYSHVDTDENALIGDSKTNPNAYFEFHLHVEAEECSQEGYVRVDTRTGEVAIVRVHGC
jgi:hypothetical protein